MQHTADIKHGQSKRGHTIAAQMKLHNAQVYAEDVAAHDPSRERGEGVGERMGERGRKRDRERREE